MKRDVPFFVKLMAAFFAVSLRIACNKSGPAGAQALPTGSEMSLASLEEIFRQRTDEDWRQVWHIERHQRCYEDLLRHMEQWVCEKDIYKLRKKRDIFSTISTPARHFEVTKQESVGKNLLPLPLLSSRDANEFFRQIVPDYRPIYSVKRQRASKRGIIEECCQGPTGCSWEEYAEYCPANRRIRS